MLLYAKMIFTKENNIITLISLLTLIQFLCELIETKECIFLFIIEVKQHIEAMNYMQNITP